MHQIIPICCLFFTFTLQIRLYSQNIWEENFNIPNKGYWADESGNLQSDISGIEWSLDISGSQFAASGDYAKTVTTSGGRFEVLDSDGNVVWLSTEMDISNYSKVSASIKVSETGSLTGADKKFIKAKYKLDGQLYPFSPDSIASGNWGVKDLKVNGIKGNQLQLVITLNSSYSNDKVILDNVLVEGIDSTLFEPQRIAFTKLQSYSFTNEETVISALVFNKKGEVITDKKFGLCFQSDRLAVTENNFENGTYSWKVTTDSTGKASFTIDFINSSVASIDSFIEFYSRENLIYSENFEKDGFSDWQNDGDWIVSSETPISGDSSIKHLVQDENGVSIFLNNRINWSLGNGNYQVSFKLKNGNWDPSSSNLFYFELVDTNLVDSMTVGYAVGVNATGTTDLVSLWTVRNGNPDRIVLETVFDWNENTMAQLDLARDPVGNWQLTVTDLNTGNSQTGKGNNNEFETINQLCLHFKYTQSRSGQLWFDDILVLRGNAPPFIKWVKTLSDGKFQACFSEEIKTELLSKENFKIESNHGKNYQIQSLEFEGKDTVTIETSTIDEVDLLLTGFNVEDLEGAVADSIEFAFEYRMPVSIHDIVIAEIMADPSPVVGLPEAEYLEIFNRSEKILDVGDLKLKVKDQISTLPYGIINPGGYLILIDSKDSALFSTLENVLILNNFPSLLNSGTAITLSTQEGIVVDSMTYSGDWHKDSEKKNGGWSLERIDPDRFCGDRNNWTSSIDISGGTPGRINSVDASNLDNLPPELLEVKLLSANSVEFIFDEEIDPVDASNIANYSFDGDLTIDSLFYNEAKNKVIVYFGTEMEVNKLYHLLITEIADDCDNASPNISTSFSRQVIDFGDIVITEIMADPTPVVDLPDAEYLEIFNHSEKNIDVFNWRLTVKENILELPTFKINSGEYLIICYSGDSSLFSSFGKVLAVNNFPSLLNAGTTIKLSTQEGLVIDSVTYSDDWYRDTAKKNGGWSLEKIDPGRFCGNRNNWTASIDVLGGTPGKVNSVDSSNLDNLPPDLLEVNLLSASSIELSFSETFIPPDIKNFTVDNGLTINCLSVDEDENTVTIIFGNKLEGNKQYQLSISELSDQCGNVIRNISVQISRQIIGPCDLVINEVLFNPYTDGADFVELFNQSGRGIDISKLRLATRSDTLTLKSVYPLSDHQIEFPDQSYLVFTRDSENIATNYWVPNPERIVEMESFPTFPDDEGHVVILNDSLIVIDEFAYSETMHSPFLSDLNGVSLERSSFSKETNDPANWHSASSLVGFATPGYENSQPEEIENPDAVSVLLNPDVISPNGDGFNDEMRITFHLDKTGYLANVYVYDINGRKVSRLLNNGLIGNSDNVVFAGIDESGNRLPMGIYILLTELVHPGGEKKIFKKSFLVTDKR